MRVRDKKTERSSVLFESLGLNNRHGDELWQDSGGLLCWFLKKTRKIEFLQAKAQPLKIKGPCVS